MFGYLRNLHRLELIRPQPCSGEDRKTYYLAGYSETSSVVACSASSSVLNIADHETVITSFIFSRLSSARTSLACRRSFMIY